MSDFAGVIRTDGGPVADGTADRLSRALDGVGKPRSWRPDASVVLVERRGRPSYDNGGDAPPMQGDENRLVLATARLDDPAGVARALGNAAPSRRDDRSLVAAACLAWGAQAAAARLYGDFALAEWDARSRRLTLARDALGIRPIYYTVQPGLVVFATTLQAMLVLPQVPRELDDVMVAHAMTIAMTDEEQTIYAAIRRVPPGGSAVFERGQCRTDRHFTLEGLRPVRLSRDDDYVEAGRGLLDRAVACRLPRDGRVASMLSGGFDSAGVTATAARLLGGDRLMAFTRAPGAAHPYGGLDERALAGLVADRYANIDWTVIDDDATSPFDAEPEMLAAQMLGPTQSSFNVTWFESLMRQVAASGASTLLQGAAGNPVLSWHGRPEFARRLRSLQWVKLLRELHLFARAGKQSTARVAAGVAFTAMAPRSLQRLYARAGSEHGDAPWLSFSLVSPSFLSEIDYHAVAGAVDHDIPFKRPITPRAKRLLMVQSQRGRDLAAYARRRWSFGLSDPYDDRAMVEFALAIPDDQYWKDGVSRRLARRVLADRVPAEILRQTGKGKQSPEWYHVASRRRDEMTETIERLARSSAARRVIDIPRMRRVIEDWPRDAEQARAHEMIHGHALQRAIAMGGFLRWHEGGNE